MKINKPWGYEHIFANTDRYVGKVLFIRKGARLSKQYHELKDETIYICNGKMELYIADNDGERSWTMEEGESFRIEPGVIHRMTALEDCNIFEVSTTELDDVVRIDDDYGRTEKK